MAAARHAARRVQALVRQDSPQATRSAGLVTCSRVVCSAAGRVRVGAERRARRLSWTSAASLRQAHEVAVDGTLISWEEADSFADWSGLLLGNGLSINVWPRFAYGSLFDYAQDAGLSTTDLALFEGTPNFERVLGSLNSAIRVAQVVGVDPAPFYERYRRVQTALGHAVREVHPERSDVSDGCLARIRDELLRYEWIFTTSYDLLLYWSMGASANGRFEPFLDHFRWAGRCEFDPERAVVRVDQIPIYFLHGALHLVVGATGRVWKLRRTAIRNLLDQFGQPIIDEPQARPLLVTEGSSRDKLAAIESNDYLSHALDRLRQVEVPMVVFGSSLSNQDDHLVDALNEHPDRPVAVSMLPGPRRSLAAAQAEIYGRLEVETLVFFDATTHPLGAADLSA
jgi:hypothetical protein